MCVQLEAEAAQLDADERAEMLEALGLGDGALPRFLRTAYHLLGLRTFFTTGEKESRAWTFRAGCEGARSAPASSTPTSSGASSGPRPSTGTSCSSSARGPRPATSGKLRVEGKDYEVADGDVMEFRFNV